MLGPTLFSIPLGFLIAAPLTALLVRLGRRTGALDSEGTPGHAKELRAVPNIGGIAVAAAALGPLAKTRAGFRTSHVLAVCKM